MNSAPTAVAFRATTRLGGRTASRREVPEHAQPRAVRIAPDLVDALAGDGEAGWRFADLPSAEQRRLARSVEAAPTADTRRRRIAMTVETLRAGRI